MNTFKYLVVILLSSFVVACGSNTGTDKNDFTIITNTKKGAISNNETLMLSLENKKKQPIDSVIYKLEGTKIEPKTDLKNVKLGKHTIESSIFSAGEKQVASTIVTILNSEAPQVFTYKIINEYPHDITSYTQGLEFYDGKLYESTGQYKESKLRLVDYKTGEVLKNINLPNEYFGEGITILNNKIYQLTWQENTGLVYDLNTFEKISSFKYGNSKEGWGICHHENTIYKSDGTETIWLLNAETLAEEDHIQIYTNRGKIIGINEMEWINGAIYANRYQKDGVAIINPKNGAVIGVIDFSDLKKQVTQHAGLDVLNGIAYNPETKTIFVTGKRWDKLFEVEIFEE